MKYALVYKLASTEMALKSKSTSACSFAKWPGVQWPFPSANNRDQQFGYKYTQLMYHQQNIFHSLEAQIYYDHSLHVLISIT